MSHRPDDGQPTIFVPLTLAEWRALVTDGHVPGPCRGFGVTADLMRWGGFEAEDVEDATFAAQTVAGVAALLLAEPDPATRRVVAAVADTGFTGDPGSALGAGVLPSLDLARVRAVFSDEPDVPVADVRAAADGMGLVQAWDDPVVAAFSESHDLGWYTVDEAVAW